MDNRYTRLIADYVEGLRYEALPPQVVEQAKKITLHTMAAIFASFKVEQAAKARRLVREKGGRREASLWGSRFRAPMEEAAFCNGTTSDILDWEDCSWTGHPSAGVIPAAFAAAEALGRSGKDYLTAVTAGYEAYQRIAMAAQPSMEYFRAGKPWAMMSWQIFAASLPAAKLMDQDSGQICQTIGASYHLALGRVAKHAAGRAKSDIYHYAHGFCAKNGVLAARVGQLGYYNCYDGLDGPKGFWSLCSDQVDFSWHERGLGEEYTIMQTYLKHWPANMWVQNHLEALDLICRRYGITAEQVREIRVTPAVPFLMEDYSLSTRGMLDAQFSIPYCLSAYLHNPEPGAHWFSAEQREDKAFFRYTTRIRDCGERVGSYDNFMLFKAGSFPTVTVELDTEDGRTLSETVQYPKGHPRNRFSMEEEMRHFVRLAEPVLGVRAAEELAARVAELEQEPRLDKIAALAAGKGGKVS